jgi:hypothetical protein
MDLSSPGPAKILRWLVMVLVEGSKLSPVAKLTAKAEPIASAID